MKINQRAYTLSELVLLIVMAGVMAVLCYSWITHRKATRQIVEQETVLQTVRKEQRRRCAMGQRYTLNPYELHALEQTDKQVRYNVSDGVGIMVKSRKYGYELRMPSYDDGRLCCENCGKVNKRYSPCERLTKRKDFIAPDPECVDPKSPHFIKPENQPSPVQAQPQPEVPAAQEKQMLDEPQEPLPLQEPQEPLPLQENATLPPLPADVENTAKPECTPEKGPSYTQPCQDFLEGTDGTVTFTWDEQRCAYQAQQQCKWPSVWKKGKVEIQTHQGVYPSDVDNLCAAMLATQGCVSGSRAGYKCAPAATQCYASCTLQDKQPVQETHSMVFYNVTLKLQPLRCSSSSKVMVEIP